MRERIRSSRPGTKYCTIKAMPITMRNRTARMMKKNRSKFMVKREEGMK